MDHECIQADKIDKLVDQIERISSTITDMRIEQARSVTEITNIMLGIGELKAKATAHNNIDTKSASRISSLEGKSGLVDKLITVLISAAVFFGFNLLLKLVS